MKHLRHLGISAFLLLAAMIIVAKATNLSVDGTLTVGGFSTLGSFCTSSGASPQTCNGQRGIATTNGLSTGAATDATYTISNSSVSTASLVACTVQSYSATYATNGDPIIESCVPGTGSIVVNLRNVNASNALTGSVGIGFIVLN